MDWKSKRSIMHRYDVTADMYDERYSEEQNRKYKKALETVTVADKAVLDVGCGSGMFFDQIASEARLVVGVDVSHGLLLKAKQQAAKYENVALLQADADHLPFRDGVFGAAFAFTVLQNMPKPQETLKELKRVVGCGGQVVATGLKKALPLERFMDILEDSGLEWASFVDEDSINCYVATSAPLNI
ncbi:MAG: methyltransferase domain-containing protein [Candidatus Bathyarchaeota archaeon]|nr:methyltransferase domain-containing protein [Candidatus Bathyarchaeota archaeon]